MAKFLWASTTGGEDVVINNENIVSVVPVHLLPEDYRKAFAWDNTVEAECCAV